MKRTTSILYSILLELEEAETKHPDWPSDILHQIAIVNEESGEATKAALRIIEEEGEMIELRKELIQTAAMCIRMLNNLEEDVYKDCHSLFDDLQNLD